MNRLHSTSMRRMFQLDSLTRHNHQSMCESKRERERMNHCVMGTLIMGGNGNEIYFDSFRLF